MSVSGCDTEFTKEQILTLFHACLTLPAFFLAALAYIYIGNFEKSERSDPQAKVILKDGTTRIGPFEKNLPVGNWWKDHEEEPMTSPGDFRSIASFGSSQESAPLGHSSHNEFLSSVNRNRVWLTFEEARKRSFGHAYWWRCTGANGETVVEKQHCVDGPPDHPVCLEGNGWMYFGGWKGRSYHGFGVIAFPNGRVFAGNLVENRCTGPAKLVWLPASPIWLKNEQPKSSILRKPKGSENEVGVPYIYIGKFKNSQRCDARATVILKDGTTRIGPFERDKPVGDWWTEHKEAETNLTSVTEVLSFATQKFPRGFHPLQRIRRRFKKKPKA